MCGFSSQPTKMLQEDTKNIREVHLGAPADRSEGSGASEQWWQLPSPPCCQLSTPWLFPVPPRETRETLACSYPEPPRLTPEILPAEHRALYTAPRTAGQAGALQTVCVRRLVAISSVKTQGNQQFKQQGGDFWSSDTDELKPGSCLSN